MFEPTHPLSPYTPGGSRDWRQRHDKWWEYEVQSLVRGLEPPMRQVGRRILLGIRADGSLGGVSVYQELDGPHMVELEAMAVALHLRRGGIRYGDELFRVTAAAVEARAIEADVRETQLIGYVFESNESSLKMCQRAGFVRCGDGGDGVQQWQRLMVHAPFL